MAFSVTRAVLGASLIALPGLAQTLAAQLPKSNRDATAPPFETRALVGNDANDLYAAGTHAPGLVHPVLYRWNESTWHNVAIPSGIVARPLVVSIVAASGFMFMSDTGWFAEFDPILLTWSALPSGTFLADPRAVLVDR